MFIWCILRVRHAFSHIFLYILLTSPCVYLCSGDGHTQTPSSLATGPNVEHQQKQVVHSPDHPVRHANASSGDAKEVMVTGSYSSDLHLPSLSGILCM